MTAFEWLFLSGGNVLIEFYFALTSESGTWAPEEMAAWQRDAGLQQRPIHFRTVPGLGSQAATKA